MRWLLGLVLVGQPSLAHDDVSRARYLGNEGILVRHGDTAILFDAFYAQGFNNYVLVPEETINRLHKGEPPYDGVTALFVSHIHGDHFSVGPTRAYLRARPEVTVFASEQVIEALIKDTGDEFKDRYRSFALEQGGPDIQVSVGSLSIGVAAIPHAGGPRRRSIQNLAFRVQVDDGVTVVHLGDATTETRWFDHLEDFFEPVDVAFPPYWFLTDESGQKVLDTVIQTETIIGVHVPSAARGQGDRWRSEAGGDLFTDPGEMRVFKDSD